MEEAAKTLIAGGVASIPTDTVYGLAAIATSPEGVERIYELKDRDGSKPLIILVADPQQLRLFTVAQEWIERASEFWPGPTSVIVPCASRKYRYLHRGTNSLAFRVPDNDDLQELLVRTGPVVAPSANPQGLPPATTSDESEDYFGAGVDCYWDGGERSAPSSRLIQFTSDGTETLR